MANKAGQSTRKMAANRRDEAEGFQLDTLLQYIVFFIGLGLLFTKYMWAALLMMIFAGAWKEVTDKKIRSILALEKRAVRGAKAEEQIGDLLEELDDEDFVVLHDIESPFGNIDHLVIHKNSGLFLLETKSHHGTITVENEMIMVNGHAPEKNFVSQTLSNSYWLREQIQKHLSMTVWITPVVVFTNGFVQGNRMVKGISVTNKKYLLSFLQNSRPFNQANQKVWGEREKLIKLLLDRKDAADSREQAKSGKSISSWVVGKVQPVQPEPLTVHMCPKCGKSMIIRKSVKGDSIGQEFYVCPDFPKCKSAIPVKDLSFGITGQP